MEFQLCHLLFSIDLDPLIHRLKNADLYITFLVKSEITKKLCIHTYRSPLFPVLKDNCLHPGDFISNEYRPYDERQIFLHRLPKRDEDPEAEPARNDP